MSERSILATLQQYILELLSRRVQSSTSVSMLAQLGSVPYQGLHDMIFFRKVMVLRAQMMPFGEKKK